MHVLKGDLAAHVMVVDVPNQPLEEGDLTLNGNVKVFDPI